MRKNIGLFVGMVLGLLGLLVAFPAGAQSEREILVLEIEAPITPIVLSYLERGVLAGEAQDVQAVLVVLDTPGGDVAVTLDIIELFRNSSVPVIVWVGPAGAQAASAGSLITLAGHASGMAPETVIGAASPILGSGEDIPETAYRKAVEDLKAVVRSLAERRGEPAVELAEQMIEDARAVSSTEAFEVDFIDAIASDVPDLLEQLDGLVVAVNGEDQFLDVAGAQLVPFELSFIEQLLQVLTNPLLVGILLTIGVQAILIELNSPGGWVAGFVGIMCIGLALFGLGQLPANWFGLGLIIVAFVLFIIEVQTPTIGALAVVGAITLVAGLLVLFNSPGTPEFARIPVAGAIVIGIVTSGTFLLIVSAAVKAQRSQPLTGKEGLAGRPGRVRTPLTEENNYTGTALIYGELWQVQATEPFGKGDTVIVERVDGVVAYVANPAGKVTK